MKFSRILLLTGLSLACVVAQAQPAQDSQRPGQGQEGQGTKEHRKPPPEALAACKSLSAGAACSFTSPRGEESGTCGAPEGKPQACRPRHASGSQTPPAKDKPKS